MASAFGKDHRQIRYQGGFEMRNGIFHLVTGTAIAIALSVSSAYAQQKYDTGATDTEIKIGQTVPFSGPASAYATIGKAQAAYIKMVNEQGGVNGRKINFIQYDDAYSPPKAVEQVRKLVESDEVLLDLPADRHPLQRRRPEIP
jgi:ABC-type branched-subunit amino acid transport system substrate-binding protein